MSEVLTAGAEFSVNTDTTFNQTAPEIAALPDGGYIIVWGTLDAAQDGSDSAIKAQRFDASGNPVGSEFLVNSEATGSQFTPDIAVFADGSFVITWTTNDPEQDGNGSAVKARLFDPGGAPAGPEFLVNSQTSSSQDTPHVTVLDNGNFVVSWADWNGFDTKAQIISSDGQKIGGEFQVNTSAAGTQDSGDIVALDGGGFVVTWRTTNSSADGSGSAVMARVFDNSGIGGAEFVVNSAKSSDQYMASVTALANGGFVVVWHTLDTTQDGSGGAVKAQLFDASGAPVGSELLVNSAAADSQREPMVTALPDGGFVVVWNTLDALQDGSASALKGQYFDASGQHAGAEFLVNSLTSGSQFLPSVATLADGSIVATWTSESGDGSGYAVRGRRFDMVTEPIEGTPGDDDLPGTSGDDVINGNGGNDAIDGGDGNDVIDGGEGNDTIDGGLGNDMIEGGAGVDTVDAGEGSDHIEAAADGADDIYNGGSALPGDVDIVSYSEALAGIRVSLWLDPADLSVHVYSRGEGDAAGIGADRLVNVEGIIGSQYDDVLAGNDADNILDGSGGNDVLVDGAGSDIVLGGEGSDLITASTGAGDDLYDGGGNFDSIYNGDVIFYREASAGVAVDLMAGTAQSLDGGNAAGIGVDQIANIEDVHGSSYGDQIAGSADHNVIRGIDGNDMISGGDGDDVLSGDEGDDMIAGGAGIDVADYESSAAGVTVSLAVTLAQDTGQGVDTLTGIENLSGSMFSDRLTGDAWANWLSGYDGADYLYGEGGDDRLDGFSGDDRLFGGAGNDMLIGWTGYDRMYGGTGDDVYYVYDADDYAYENAGEGHDLVIASLDHQLRAEVEDLTLTGGAYIGKGNAGDNGITGNANGNKLYGYGGSDSLDGGGGDDYLFGDVGNDRLTGGAGYDRMYGGLGDDIYIVGDSTDYAYENAGEGTDRVVASINHTLRAEVEELELTGTADLRGWGNAGNNLLLGNSGNNLIYGRGGDDAIWGADGNDIVYGENGDDGLQGGAGQDRYYGGAGADNFIFEDGDFAGMTSATADRIHDFSRADGDRILLGAVDADTHAEGLQDFAFIGNGAFTGVAGQLRYQQISGNTYVQGDTDGDGTADFWIRVDGLHTMQASDFIN